MIDAIVAASGRTLGSIPIDDARARALAGRVVDRTTNIAAALKNHEMLEPGDLEPARIDGITAPTLVLHGTEDPLFPYPHGEALAREIPGAALVPLPGVGHHNAAARGLGHRDPGDPEPHLRRLGRAGGPARRQSLAAGDPTGWFEELYRSAADARGAHAVGPGRRVLAARALGRRRRSRRRAARAAGRHGGPSSWVAGSAPTPPTSPRAASTPPASIVSETAIATARQRFPDSGARYELANLLDLPGNWLGSFDLVVEIFTVQAMPRSVRAAATAAVRSLVAPGGTLVAIEAVADADIDLELGPPFPLTREEIDAFAGAELTAETIEPVDYPGAPGERRWLAEFRRR